MPGFAGSAMKDHLVALAVGIVAGAALGALMLLTGNQVFPLWQTPLLPLLYVWAAAFIGTATTIGSVLLCCLTWKRPIDQSIMDELVSLMNLLIFPWIALRLLDVVVRGRFLMMFNSGFLSLLFWAEMLCILDHDGSRTHLGPGGASPDTAADDS